MKSSGSTNITRLASGAGAAVTANRQVLSMQAGLPENAGSFSATYFDMDRPAALGLAPGAFVRDVEKAEGNYDPELYILPD
jgi:hypothetical protein